MRVELESDRPPSIMSLISFCSLFALLLMFSSGVCMDAVWRPSISRVQALSDEQRLMVTWRANTSGLVGERDVYQVQIGLTENLTIVYNASVSVSPLDSHQYTWTWTSALPLECEDHSVRIRRLYNRSEPSPWSDWAVHYGARPEKQTQIFPFQRVLREGSDVLLCCVPPAGVHITSMAFDNSNYNLISVGDRVKAIAVKELTIPDRLIKPLLFSCSDSTQQTLHFWNYVSFPPSKPCNISCVTADMATVTCTWDPGREPIPFDYNVEEVKLRIQNSDQVGVACEPLSCSFPVVPRLEEYNITVVVRNQLGEERESHSFNLSDRVFPVVESDIVIPGVTDATLSWIVRGNLTGLGLHCQATADPNSLTTVNCQNVSGLCEVKLEHLHPNSRYSSRLRCAVRGKRWGDWTQPRTFITYPLVTLDLWRRIEQPSSSHTRQVTLLWTPRFTGSAAEVNIRGYALQWSQGGENRTRRQDRGQTQAGVSVGPGRCDITVEAVLDVGSSVPAHITVSQLDHRDGLPAERRLSGSLAAGFNLSWHEQGSAPCGHVVDWCTRGSKESCDLKWIKVPEGNVLILPAEHFQADQRYTFSIYACTEHGHTLLDRQTGYLQEPKPQQLPVVQEPVHSTSSSVTLVWSYDEEDLTRLGFITGFLVTVQEASERSQGHMTNVSVADPHSNTVTIEGLSENTEYTLCLSALTKEGPGPPARVTIRTATNYSYLVTILAPILFLLGVVVLLWPQRKTLKEFFAYPAGMNIKTLNLDDLQHETREKLQHQTVEEFVVSEIEILNVGRPLTSTQTDAELQNTPPTSAFPSPSPSSVSLPSDDCVSLIGHYYPQLSAELLQRSDFQKSSLINRSYFNPTEEEEEEDSSEAHQVTLSVTDDYVSHILHE
ncbi:leukemia inhibitory factor receptor isoform X2 [Genypterus blacodes]|uniref:leukemia inhibitory factor receptor isoform X2 n=1 Tax=Genypterus blacodes TaxID=154954 RepID=UPI003F7756C4